MTSPRAEIRVLVVDDEDPFRDLLVRRLSREGDRVVGFPSAEGALRAAEEQEFDVAVLDIRMPGMDGVELLELLKSRQPAIEAVILTGHATVETAVGAMKRGAYEYLEKPVNWALLRQAIDKAAEKRRLTLENRSLREVLRRERPEWEIVGESPAIQRVRVLIERIAPSESAALIEGESGTGKELVARAIHRGSPRSSGPFIAVNCGALQENLLENELFGHAKGAYTSASENQPGLFEMADGGILFIDEVCEMGPGCQKKFLRVLEQGEFRRLGENRIRTCNVRVVAATNRMIEEEVRQGRFREDLYFRLNVLRIEVPPLRERKDDVPLLAQHFLARLRKERGIEVEVEPAALRALDAYDWPGNVRELQNVMERGAILANGGRIAAADVPDLLGKQRLKPAASHLGPGPWMDGLVAAGLPASPPGPPVPPDRDAAGRLDLAEREHIRAVLLSCGGNKTRTAERLGISLRSLYRKLDKHGLK